MPAGAGVRDALSILNNLALLLRQSASRATLDGVLNEVESATANLRVAFALARPELRVFVEERLQTLDAALFSARQSGAWDGVLEPSQRIAADMAAACDLYDLCELLRDRKPLAQSLDAIARDLVQHWHPLAPDGTLRLHLTEAASAREIFCDPRVAVHLLGVVASLIDGDAVTVSQDGDAFVFQGGESGDRTMPRLRRIAPTLEVTRFIVSAVGGALEKRGSVIRVSLARR